MDARFFAFKDCDNLEPPLEKPKKQCRMKTPGRSGHGCPLWTQIRSCAHVPVCATLCSGEAGVLAYFSFKISSKFSLLSGRASGIIYLYIYTCLQVLSSRADMPIHEIRIAVLRFFTERAFYAQLFPESQAIRYICFLAITILLFHLSYWIYRKIRR